MRVVAWRVAGVALTPISGRRRDRMCARRHTAARRPRARHPYAASDPRQIPVAAGIARVLREVVSEPAMKYVTRWRMHVALSTRETEGATVAELADRLGYRSEAAFARAFKRVVGIPPGAVRYAAPLRSSP
jgi:hypothetical protein